jgi:hypothetical protein
MFTTSSFGFILTYVVTIYESIHTINILFAIMKHHCMLSNQMLLNKTIDLSRKFYLYQPIVHQNPII